ncbi:MAG TPA: sel1 repeat family protein, partial [Rhodobacterales bacterium]|nr:sel1 repeat family protein [Rhodobacterales bacterium]
ASMYVNGLYVDVDYEKAAELYRKAAENGLARAQANLGYLYQKGRGVEQDYAEAARWYRVAADQGSTRGMLDLGTLYFLGEGVERNRSKAFELFDQSRKAGDVRAYVYLGNVLEMDEELKDPTRAAGYYIEALRHGIDWAITRLFFKWDQATARAMQQQLADLGLYSGPVNGEIDEASRAAMKQLLPPE